MNNLQVLEDPLWGCSLGEEKQVHNLPKKYNLIEPIGVTWLKPLKTCWHEHVILENIIKIIECTGFIVIFSFLMNLTASLEAREVDHCIAVSLPIWESNLEVAKAQFICLTEPWMNGILACIYCVNWIFSLKLLSQDIHHSRQKYWYLKVRTVVMNFNKLKSIARTGPADYFYTILFIYPHQLIDCSSVVKALWYLSWEEQMNNEIEVLQGFLTDWLCLLVVINLLNLMVSEVKQVFSQFKTFKCSPDCIMI